MLRPTTEKAKIQLDFDEIRWNWIEAQVNKSALNQIGLNYATRCCCLFVTFGSTDRLAAAKSLPVRFQYWQSNRHFTMNANMNIANHYTKAVL